jgi:hypothetical protein
MAKNKKKSGKKFVWFMVIYTLIFVLLAGAGLYWFWGFMEAYEASRPHKPVEAYMQQLTAEHIVDNCADLIAQVDHNIQSEEDCRNILLDELAGEFTYARKASACTETSQTYVLKIGRQVIGSFTTETTQKDEYGFAPWVFSGEEFDLSYLLTKQTVSATVPEGYNVRINGFILDDTYLTESKETEFEVLEDYYGKYELPMFVLNTYEAGPFLREEFVAELLDPQGEIFVFDETFDKNLLIHNCDEATEKELTKFVKKFLDLYVIFSGCANDDRFNNFKQMMPYLVPGSDLVKRMEAALDGMQFAQSRGDKVDTVTIHHMVQMDADVYMVDVTYLVNTIGREGMVQTTNNTRITIVRQNNSLLVESMISY